MSISASDVKNLREKTGAGMMDCKKALTECSGDLEAAVDFLRKKGLAAAQKKQSRIAAEGAVVTAVQGNKAVVLEVNCETDFVSKGDDFQNFAQAMAKFVLSDGVTNIEALKEACPDYSGDWYFSGNYPTPGGNRVANRAFINYIEKNNKRAY